MMHDRFRLARSRAQFGRLLALSEQQRQAMERDPGPFLDMAYARLDQATRALEDARAALSGMDVIGHSFEPERIRSMESMMFERNKKALEVIDSALHPKEEPRE